MKATAKANSNIALIKYWGKRNSELILPMNSSISMTLSRLFTTTTVEFNDSLKQDEVNLNEKDLEFGAEKNSVIAFLNLIRKKAKINSFARVASSNNFPTAAGLASSASGFAALALSASTAAELKLNEKDLSILARQGSGSASRSVLGGFVEWLKGRKEDGSDSYAKQLFDESHWPEFRMLTTIVETEEKKVKSRAGMSQTMKTCALYNGWLDSVHEDLISMKKGLKDKNFSLVGETAELNALKMHATMISTDPPIIYWNSSTMNIIHAVHSWREEGMECFFTIDAGPNVKVMCLQKDEKELTSRLKKIQGVKDLIACSPGKKAELIQEHLF